MELYKMYSATFFDYEAKKTVITLRNIRGKKGVLISSSRSFPVENVTNLPPNLKYSDDITFFADDKLTKIDITHVNFVEVKND